MLKVLKLCIMRLSTIIESESGVCATLIIVTAVLLHPVTSQMIS